MSKSFVTIKIENYLFGIDVDFVREVNRYFDISPVSLAPDFIIGLMNLRGQIITVIDPGLRLHLGKRELSSSSICVVIKTASELYNKSMTTFINDTIGILVNAVGDIILVDETTIEDLPPNLSEFDNEYISGIVKLKDDLLLILNMDTLLRNDIKKALKH